MPFAIRAESHVSGLDGHGFAVVTVFAFSAEDVIDLAISAVLVIADAAARQYRNVVQGTAFIVQFFRVVRELLYRNEA